MGENLSLQKKAVFGQECFPVLQRHNSRTAWKRLVIMPLHKSSMWTCGFGFLWFTCSVLPDRGEGGLTLGGGSGWVSGGQQLNLYSLTYLTGIHVLQTSLNNFLAASISWVSNHIIYPGVLKSKLPIFMTLLLDCIA